MANIAPIQKLVQTNECSPLRLVPKIRMEHISNLHFQKMKASTANHVISNSVASAFRTMVENGSMPQHLVEVAKSTAGFVSIFNG